LGGAFVWERRALNRQNLRLAARVGDGVEEAFALSDRCMTVRARPGRACGPSALRCGPSLSGSV
jgi:hypothetical protein